MSAFWCYFSVIYNQSAIINIDTAMCVNLLHIVHLRKSHNYVLLLLLSWDYSTCTLCYETVQKVWLVETRGQLSSANHCAWLIIDKTIMHCKGSVQAVSIVSLYVPWARHYSAYSPWRIYYLNVQIFVGSFFIWGLSVTKIMNPPPNKYFLLYSSYILYTSV